VLAVVAHAVLLVATLMVIQLIFLVSFRLKEQCGNTGMKWRDHWIAECNLALLLSEIGSLTMSSS
jgi:hypothetical protein